MLSKSKYAIFGLLSIVILCAFLFSSGIDNNHNLAPNININNLKCGTSSPDKDSFVPESVINNWMINNPDYSNRNVLEVLIPLLSEPAIGCDITNLVLISE